jgi:hypothetical protein
MAVSHEPIAYAWLRRTREAPEGYSGPMRSFALVSLLLLSAGGASEEGASEEPVRVADAARDYNPTVQGANGWSCRSGEGTNSVEMTVGLDAWGGTSWCNASDRNSAFFGADEGFLKVHPGAHDQHRLGLERAGRWSICPADFEPQTTPPAFGSSRCVPNRWRTKRRGSGRRFADQRMRPILQISPTVVSASSARSSTTRYRVERASFSGPGEPSDISM